ncbi:uncharacterized protein LOC110026760 isoform X2 [Phalaenopsis equestris]|uniref:uncharacterized protein LOC110026760 isoform X2 n=1 Tax=Phalaenopsis equestris TaxID=78828 RepID=UPI0009E3C3D8|nr:uncharacterized protein LOC110026760 isoform X2 [Phalaenopsis equestris]
MGASNSKIEEDKALTLCQERKRFVKQALDGRCLLAAAHVSYVNSLRNSGTALTKFVEALDEASLLTSTSKAREPHSSLVKHNSHLSNTSSPAHSSPPSRRFHVNHMAAARIPSVTIEERPPVQLAATLQTLSPSSCSESHSKVNSFHVNHMKTSKFASTTIEERLPTPVRAIVETSSPLKSLQQNSEENSSSEAPTPPGIPPWDYFGPFHPLDNQFSIERKTLGHGFDNVDYLKHLREEEGIPELEDEGEPASLHNKDDDSVDSRDDFDQISDEPFVQIYRNRNDGSGDPLNASLAIPSADGIASGNDEENGEHIGSNHGLHHEEISMIKFQKTSPTTAALLMNGMEMENGSGSKSSEDYLSCVKEIEILFLKASESGEEVPRMLEVNKMQFRPLSTEETVPASNEMKYLPWHGSMSSISSSSRIPSGTATKDDSEDLNSNLLGSTCMNSGSHASTLDRLYAWERKLYDEVKASGFIRREYDLKRRMLRQQDSRGESAYKIDKTRSAVKDLHSRIRVAIHRINSISMAIEELRDKELQPQLEELIAGLTRMWAVMLECHKNQHKLISDASNNISSKVSVHSESHQQATLHLQQELNSLSSNFSKWLSKHKSYLKAINNWLLKCVLMPPAPKQKSSRRRPPQFSPRTDIAPPIFVTCRNWLDLMDELPEQEVEDAISDLIEVTGLFLPRTEKGNGSLRSTFSLSRRVKGGEHYEEIERNDVSVDWSLNYDSLQSSLVVFFDRLKSFAESSLVKYEALEKAILEARFRYENYDNHR